MNKHCSTILRSEELLHYMWTNCTKPMLKCSSKPQWKEVWETSSADTQTSAKTSPDCRNTLYRLMQYLETEL